MNRVQVVMLTSLYPWGPGEEFITAELPQWVRDDVKLTIMPWQTNKVLREVPEGIAVDTRLAQARQRTWRAALARQAVSPLFWREAWQEVRHRKITPKLLWRTAVPSAAASLSRSALRSFAREHGPIDVAYSYWFDHQCLGALTAGEAVRRVVSRCHRYDLYEEHSPDGYLPFKRYMAARIDLLAPISHTGLDYVRSRFNAPEHRCACYRLGVPLPQHLAPVPSAADEIALLSVSNVVPVKRVPLLIETVAHLARLLPQHNIIWQHAGAGPGLTQAQQLAAQQLPDNARVTWLGHLDKEQLTATLTGRAWNFLVNVSSSEGVPVSLMEAMACAIPVAATEVGATAELVAPPGGLLLQPAASPATWAQQLLAALPRTLDGTWRQGFRSEIEQHWDEQHNLPKFIDAVVALGRANGK